MDRSMYSKMKYKNRKSGKGFTLIELLVSMAVFTTVVLISMGSILSVFDANQKSKTLRSVMDNINLTMEGMTRTIRFGKNYHCGSAGDVTSPQDCGGAGDNSLTLLAVDGSQVAYSLVGGRIARSTNGGTNEFLTSPDVTITTLAFRVYGSSAYVSGSVSCSAPNDCFQPQVIVVISGNVGVKVSTKSTFTLETTISQRAFDFK